MANQLQRLTKTKKLAKIKRVTVKKPNKTYKYTYKVIDGKRVRIGDDGYSDTRKLCFKNGKLTKFGEEIRNNMNPGAQKELDKYVKAHHLEGVTMARYQSHLMSESDRFFYNLNIDREKAIKDVNKSIEKWNKEHPNNLRALLPMNASYNEISNYVEWSYEDGYSIRVF